MSSSCPPCPREVCKEPSRDEIKQMLIEILEIIGMITASVGRSFLNGEKKLIEVIVEAKAEAKAKITLIHFVGR